jgi:hypothetical protein
MTRKADWRDNVEFVIFLTGHDRFLELCDDSHPLHEDWRLIVTQVAEQLRQKPPSPLNFLKGLPEPTIKVTDVPIDEVRRLCRISPEFKGLPWLK